MSKFNYSKQISSQDELNGMILAIVPTFQSTHSAIARFRKKHQSANHVCRLLHDILNYIEFDDKSLPNYQCLPDDFNIYEYTNIDSEFFDNFVVRRMKLLHQNLCELPNNHDPLTWNMIENCGNTIANRIFEKCNDVKGFKAAYVPKDLSRIIRDIFIATFKKNHPELLDLLAYSVLLLCKCSDIISVDQSLYEKVQNIESYHGNYPKFTEDDFPSLHQ